MAFTRSSPCGTWRRLQSITATRSASRSRSSTAVRRPTARSRWANGPGPAPASISRRPMHRAPAPGLAVYLNVGPGIDALYATYRARGVDLVGEVVHQPWGARELALR